MACTVFSGRVMNHPVYQAKVNLMNDPSYLCRLAQEDHKMYFSDGTFQKFYPVFVATAVICGVAAVLPGTVTG